MPTSSGRRSSTLGVFAASTVVAVLYRFVEERLGPAVAHLVDETQDRRLPRGAEILARQRIGGSRQSRSAHCRGYPGIHRYGVVVYPDHVERDAGRDSVLGCPLDHQSALFAIGVCYAALGTAMAVYLGRPLLGLNYAQSAREADFRASLIHVGENAEAMALTRSEGRLTERLHKRIDELADNFRRVIRSTAISASSRPATTT